MSEPSNHEADTREVQEMLAQFDAPAYVRRARRVEQALELLLEQCRLRRAEWLTMPRLRLGQLAARAGEWVALLPFLDAEQVCRLEALHAELAPRLRLPIEPSTSPRALRGALVDYGASAERFNRRWTAHLAEIDLSEINALREGYNHYYVLEKECAVRNGVLARLGFQPMVPLTTGDLERLLPPLFVPAVRY
jgi:hypothetical protein